MHKHNAHLPSDRYNSYTYATSNRIIICKFNVLKGGFPAFPLISIVYPGNTADFALLYRGVKSVRRLVEHPPPLLAAPSVQFSFCVFCRRTSVKAAVLLSLT